MSPSDENCSRNIQSQERKGKRCGTLFELDLLDCPICCEPLTIPIFQCDNGHVACNICCPKLKNKCPWCGLSHGHKRNRIMEKILEAIMVPCRNVELGCIENIPYERQSSHEKDYCLFSPCACPKCDYSAFYKTTYFHYLAGHWIKPNTFFSFDESKKVWMKVSDKMFVLTTLSKSVIFVVQCFREASDDGGGVYVTMNCIAPLVDEVGKFSYRISCSFHGQTLTHQETDMKKVRQLSFEIPQDKKSLMFISNTLFSGRVLEIQLCISEVKPN